MSTNGKSANGPRRLVASVPNLLHGDHLYKAVHMEELPSNACLLGPGGGGAGAEAPALAPLPLLAERVLVDDRDAAVVLVFPKSAEVGGTVDPRAWIDDPLGACRRLFLRQRNPLSARSLDAGFEPLEGGGPVRAAVYQELVRAKLLEIFGSLGLTANASPSIDGDEVLLRLSLGEDAMRSLAHHYKYRMPFRFEAYSGVAAQGADHPGNQPMMNAGGRHVPAYKEFSLDLQESLEPFRQVDEIRLLRMCLNEWVDLEEMTKQNVTSKVFAAANYGSVVRLHSKWGSLSNIWQLPNLEHEEEVRDYFGEMITLFFRWFACYTRFLALLAGFGLLCALTRLEVLNISHENHTYFRIAFAFAMTGWTSVYNKLFKSRAARANQMWGMKDWDHQSMERPEYDPALEGTWCLWRRKRFTELFVCLFCVLFACGIVAIEYSKMLLRRGGHEQLEQHMRYSTVVLIRVVSFVWGKFAPRLVDLQNHRTQARWNRAMTWVLASVKLFVALFPFVNLAFIQRLTQPTCAASLEEAARKVYHSVGWPAGVPSASPPAEGDLGWLAGFYAKRDGQACIDGCFPVECHGLDGGAGGGEGVQCRTNCQLQLERELMSVFATHTVCTVLFLLIPIVLTRREVQREMAKAKAARKEADAAHYSFIQYQAKCCEQAPYEYYSWGGSYVEDFLELAVGYALLTCFGISMPLMAVYALVAHVVEYRLLAYRMTNVTCRPMPAGDEGIGAWQAVFEGISAIAIAINVGLAVFTMYPIRQWSASLQFGTFIVLEHAMMLLHHVAAAVLPEEPEDVRRIEDFNTHFKANFAKSQSSHAGVRPSACSADLRLGPTVTLEAPGLGRQLSLKWL